MKDFKNSVILMGIDWSKAAKLVAKKEIGSIDKELADVVDLLDRDIRN